MKTVRPVLRAVGLLAFVFPGILGAADFFGDLPRKGYIRDDVNLQAVSAADGRTVVATIRYLRLALDPGRRETVLDSWAQREILLVERASGEHVAFERVSRFAGAREGEPLPLGRLALDGGALEVFSRSGGGSECAALDTLLQSGGRELPLARGDLSSRSVREAVARAVEAVLSPQDRDVVAETVPVLLGAQSQGIPVGPLDVLQVLFPGRRFAASAAGLQYRYAPGAPLDPASGAWRSVTEAIEMLPGDPLY